jgi:hypothetical protein
MLSGFTCQGELGSTATEQRGPSQPVDSAALVAVKFVFVIDSSDEELP